MNWELLIDQDPPLFSWLLGARERLVFELAERRAVWGVGLAATEPPAALLLIDENLPGVEPRLYPHEREEPTQPDSDWGLIRERTWRFVPVQSLSGQARALVGEWDPPNGALVLPVTSPQALSSPIPLAVGGAIRSAKGQRGTVGPRLAQGRKYGFLTAGHVAGEAGTLIFRARPRWRLPWIRVAWERAGEVAFSSDPINTRGIPGWDAAVVRSYKVVVERPHIDVPLALNPALPEPLLGEMFGGISGRCRVMIIGALAAHGNASRMWADCWVMGPSGVAVDGDSGSVVITSDGQCVGLLVGGSRFGDTSRLDFLYVQDMDSLTRNFLEPHGVPFR